MSTQQFRDMIARAHAELRAKWPRAGYAHDVLSGHQRWSGADLKGKAKRYGGGYATQRSHARYALRQAGGVIIPTGNGGKLRSALYIGMDDYGNAMYATRAGTAVANGTTRYRIA